MIVKTEELAAVPSPVAMVSGGFDPLHDGHVAYFAAARDLGVPVLCNITGDSYVSRKHPPLLDQGRRASLVDAIRYLDYTHVSDLATHEVLALVRPRFFVKGRDWESRLPQEEMSACADAGTEIVYLDTLLDSSTGLLERCLEHFAGRDFTLEVERFEAAVSEQAAVPAGHYDDDYFVSDWREQGNRYDIDTRRRVEGRNPGLIKEVFDPARVLDVGCGPGALMYLLHELGLEVDGIDFSRHSASLAPPEVSDRILVGEVTDPHVAPRAYDLVVCREVMEHLTVLQVRRCVEQLCRASSRYVYVTTRFHEDPDSLLSFTTQFAVDPTHITLLNKEFLRCLFVLEGFHSRRDLEQRMDWGRKGRVLVLERNA